MTRSRRGAAALEFALSLTVVMMLAGAVFDYGFYLRSLACVNNAVREGARAGARTAAEDAPGPEDVALTGVARVLADAGVGADSYDALAEVSGEGDDAGLTVRVSVPFTPLVGLVPTPSAAEAEMTMRLQYPE